MKRVLRLIFLALLASGCQAGSPSLASTNGLQPTTAELTPTREMTATKPATSTPQRTRTSTLEKIVPPSCSEAGQMWTSPVDNMEMVCIPAGPFLMGGDPLADPNVQPNEQPAHEVEMSAYWIDRTEVSNAQFGKFVLETNHKTGSEEMEFGYLNGKFVAGVINWRYPYGEEVTFAGFEEHPVIQISWIDAYEYCQWAGRDLPTEAQWEKAARWNPETKNASIFPWGNNKSNVVMGNFASFTQHPPFTVPVNSFFEDISYYGVVNMAGNVREWIRENYSPEFYVASPVKDPVYIPIDGGSGEFGNIVRGGGWASPVTDIRTTAREGVLWGLSKNGEMVGFRCAYQIR